MEAKILELRRNRKKEIFGFLTFWFGRIFPEKSVLTEKKWKKFVCLLRAPFPFQNCGGGSWGFAGRVCFLLRRFFSSPAIALAHRAF